MPEPPFFISIIMGKWRDERLERKRLRNENRQDRRDSRAERKSIRQGNSTARTESRQQTKGIAYENGIDPNAWISQTVGAGTQGIAQGIGAFFGGKANMISAEMGNSPQGGFNMFSGDAEAKGKSQTTTVAIAVGILVLGILTLGGKGKNKFKNVNKF